MKTSKKVICLLLTLIMVVSSLPMVEFKAEADTVEENTFGMPTGYVDYSNVNIDYSLKNDSCNEPLMYTALDSAMGNTLPKSFSSVDKGWITDVRSQGIFCTCWAFAANAAAEASVIKNNGYNKNTTSFSPAHTAYWTYSDAYDKLNMLNGDKTAPYCNTYDSYSLGGNWYDVALTFAKGIGPVDESQVPYTQYAGKTIPISKSYQVNNGAQLKSVYSVSLKDDPDYVKNMIMKYGAGTFVYNSSAGIYYKPNKLYNGEYFVSYSCNKKLLESFLKENNNGWHMVTLVGWDDNFPSENFDPKCGITQNGAWLIKNSWGKNNWTTVNGYTWISYYDASLGTSAFFEFETVHPYENIYQYDGTSYWGCYSNTKGGYMANIFTSKCAETLKAVSFFTLDTKVDYEVKLYRNVKDTPTSGELVSTITGKTLFVQYITVPLDKQIQLRKGEKYSVVVNFKNGRLPVDKNCSYYSKDNNNNIKWLYYTDNNTIQGTSYYSSNGTSWTDVAPLTYSFRIKAFTDPTIKKGDVDLDGRISIKDATMIQKYIVQMIELNAEQKEQADVNCDGVIDVLDATIIQQALCGLIDLKTYTVFFDGNGATSGTMNRQIITSGYNAHINANQFKKESCSFSGWYAQKTVNGVTYMWCADKNRNYGWYTNVPEGGHRAWLSNRWNGDRWMSDLSDEDNGEVTLIARWNDYNTSTTTIKSLSDKTLNINNKNIKFSNTQGMTPGTTFIYAVKPDSNKQYAIMYRTNKNTGKQDMLKHLRGGKKYDYITGLGYANDMSIAGINNKTALFVATNDTASYSVVRMSVDGDAVTTTGNFNLYYNGSKICPSGIAKYGHSGGSVHFFFTSGNTVYKASIPDNKSSGSIALTRVCYLNKTQVMINNGLRDVSSYGIQGIYYSNVNGGTLYVPVTTDNAAVIITYQGFNRASGTMYAHSPLSFEVKGASGASLNVQACGMASDGKLYFDVNRANNGDAILCFNDYKDTGNNIY